MNEISTPTPTVVALAGGVGGARLAAGLTQIWSPENVTVVINTGDDFDHLGLRICPDIDTVTYTLSGIGNPEQGWGVTGESYAFMQAVRRLGGADWFALGDQDLATHVLRTHALSQGQPLSAVTGHIAQALGIRSMLLPMSDMPVATIIDSDEGVLPFQEYFVHRQCTPRLRSVSFDGAATATAAPGVIEALRCKALEAVIFCPSNPFVSVAPILAIPGISEAVFAAPVPRIAVSPIVGGGAIKGPAAKMMAELGLNCSALGIAQHYSGMIDALVIDTMDAGQAEEIRALGIAPIITNSIMRTPADRAALAATIRDWVRQSPN